MAYAECKVEVKGKKYRVLWQDSGHRKGYTVFDDLGRLSKNKANTGAAISAFQREMERLFTPGDIGMNARLDAVLKTP